MTTTRKPGDRTDNTPSWGAILSSFGVPPASSMPPPRPSAPSLPPPRATMPSLPPARAISDSIAPTACDVDLLPQIAVAPDALADMPELRAVRGNGKGFVAICGMAVATLAFAAVWSHTTSGAAAAAAGEALQTSLSAAPAHVAKEIAPFVPTLPSHPFREIVREEEQSQRAALNESKVRHEELWSLRAMPRAHRASHITGSTPESVIREAQPRRAPAAGSTDSPQVGYETTVIGEFAGKI